MVTTTVKIKGMSCGHCVMAVKKALGNVPGIKSFQVEVGSAVIESEGAIDTAKVKEAIEDQGYDVVGIQ